MTRSADVLSDRADVVAGEAAMTVRYCRPFVTDTTIPGERKCDGIIPGHPGGGALQVAQDRWVIFFATLNPAGSDCNRSILYQLRADAPDGPLLREGMIDQGVDDWDPLGCGDRLVKSCGMPIAFGVPKGAVCEGQPLESANCFVVKWYRWAHLRRGDRIVRASDRHSDWPEGMAIKQRTLRVEWMQFRLNDAGDDIERLTEPTVMRQRGYETGEAFCSLGSGIQMNHAMKAPVPEDERCLSWVSCDTFTLPGMGRYDHGSVAPVRFIFNRETGLYEWIQTGRRVRLPERIIGEASVNRVGDEYVICLRCFEYDGRSGDTVWFCTSDLFGDWGQPVMMDSPAVPRIAFVCGDGRLRLFSNEPVEGDADSRAVLSCWDVDLHPLRLGRRRVVVDARQMGWPFADPLVDMAKLCPVDGRRQLLLFRVIDRAHTANLPLPCRSNDEAAMAIAGIHAAELTFSRKVQPAFAF